MNVSESTQIKPAELLLILLSILPVVSFGLVEANYTVVCWFSLSDKKMLRARHSQPSERLCLIFGI